MSQPTFSPGATQVAEPPVPLLPAADDRAAGDDNRRKLMIVAAAAGVVVLAIVAFFLMKGGSASTGDSATLPPRHHHAAPVVAAQPPSAVKLPKHVNAPVGRDPFKALYVAPATAGVGAAPGTTGAPGTTSSTPPSTTTTSGGTSSTTTPTATAYHPVWVQLRWLSASSATFDVGYSNGKTLKAVRFALVKPLHTFGSRFELLSIRTGVVTVKYGDGSPFQLDKSRNTMVVD